MSVGVDQTGHKDAACSVEDLFPLFFSVGEPSPISPMMPSLMRNILLISTG